MFKKNFYLEKGGGIVLSFFCLKNGVASLILNHFCEKISQPTTVPSMIEQATTNHYQQIFGSKPDLMVRAPGRINLIGEHTDYNCGFVLPAAIDKAIWLAMGRRNDGELHFHSLDLNDSYRGDVGAFQKSEKSWANYLLGVISEAQKDGLVLGGQTWCLVATSQSGQGFRPRRHWRAGCWRD